MWRKVIIRAMAVVMLSAASIVAYASYFSDKGSEKVALSKEGGATEIPVKVTGTPVETLAPATLAPEPTEEPENQSLIMSMAWGAEESYLLAKIAMAEAENQDTEGKALVILVVLNRVWSDGFPNNIRDVIYQQGQFSPISNGRFDKIEPDADCWEALAMIMMDKWDESHGATYFESKSESTWHSKHLEFLFRHGDHYFYKDRE